MKGCRLYIGLVILLLQVSSATAQRKYQYACLERIATSLQISSELDTLGDGIFTYSYQRKPIKVCIDKGRIHHIGYMLFPSSFRHQSFSIIYDFIERYLLELHLKTGKERDVNSRLEQDGVTFYRGNFGVMLSLVGHENLNVLLEEQNAKTYMITLSSKQDTCVLSFPMEYDLLHTTDMLESEKNIVEDLIATEDSLWNPEYPDTSFLVSNSNGLSVLIGKTMYTEKLSSNRFYILSEERLSPVDDKVFIKESLANLIGGLIPDNHYKMRIQLIKYNYQSEYLYSTLNQWIRFCIDSNCQSYFGLIDINDEIAECEWIMKNEEEGYCHLMRIYVPIKHWEEKEGEIIARLNSFIPTSKIKNLYEEFNK